MPEKCDWRLVAQKDFGVRVADLPLASDCGKPKWVLVEQHIGALNTKGVTKESVRRLLQELHLLRQPRKILEQDFGVFLDIQLDEELESFVAEYDAKPSDSAKRAVLIALQKRKITSSVSTLVMAGTAHSRKSAADELRAFQQQEREEEAAALQKRPEHLETLKAFLVLFNLDDVLSRDEPIDWNCKRIAISATVFIAFDLHRQPKFRLHDERIKFISDWIYDLPGFQKASAAWLDAQEKIRMRKPVATSESDVADVPEHINSSDDSGGSGSLIALPKGPQYPWST